MVLGHGARPPPSTSLSESCPTARVFKERRAAAAPANDRDRDVVVGSESVVWNKSAGCGTCANLICKLLGGASSGYHTAQNFNQLKHFLKKATSSLTMPGKGSGHGGTAGSAATHGGGGHGGGGHDGGAPSSQQSADARAAAFNPQHAAYNPTSQFAGSAMASRSQPSMDARAASFNPQHSAYNPNTSKK